MIIDVNETIRIRNVLPSDWEDLVRIEEENFSPEEAASPETLRLRIEHQSDTFFVLEAEGQVRAYLSACVIAYDRWNDRVFEEVASNPAQGGFAAVMSLSVDRSTQGQGFGSLLLAVLKQVVQDQARSGILLTCHDELVDYYRMNGFVFAGMADSNHGGIPWCEMKWEVEDGHSAS